MSVAPTRVPDLGASSQAGCRLFLRAWKKKHRMLLLCGFRVVVATFWSSVSLISARLWPPAAWLRLKALKFHSRWKTVYAVDFFFFGRTDHDSVRDRGDYWLIWACPLPADAACLPPLSRVTQMWAGKQHHLTVEAGKVKWGCQYSPTAPPAGRNAAVLQNLHHISTSWVILHCSHVTFTEVKDLNT